MMLVGSTSINHSANHSPLAVSAACLLVGCLSFAASGTADSLASVVQPARKAATEMCCTGTGKPLADMIQKLSPPAAADMLASILSRDTAFKQLVLEAVDNNERMRLVVGLLEQVCHQIITCQYHSCCLSLSMLSS